MLSFLSPLFLVGAAAAAVPVVLHLLKREPEARVKFAAVKLLKQAPVEHTQKRHLRELLLLALRVAALVLLAFAFARPFFPASAVSASGGITIVALDTSYSLSAPGQFDRARQLAKDAVARAPTEERPDFSATIGFVLPMDLESRANLRGLPNDSRYSRITSVNGSDTQYPSRSLPEISALLPIDTTLENPRSRATVKSIAASPTAPLWLASPMRPAGGARGPKLAFMGARGSALITPIQFGPIRRMP